ncbi:MAG: ribosome biogenesis GTP-binding protein YihA/YsxC, partial [Candidatus Paceibacterota bacterium]
MVSQKIDMKTPEIQNIEFMRGILGSDSILEDSRPHIAFVGRSNVGKSSTLNCLAGRNIAYTSKKPGKTQEINFFLVNDSVYFVDLPGYGYARISAHEAEKLRKHMIWYLSESGVQPRWVVLILDAKVGITDLDRDMLDILAGEGHRVLILANKMDKLNQKESHAALKGI